LRQPARRARTAGRASSGGRRVQLRRGERCKMSRLVCRLCGSANLRP
jgi:hypothetical protein